MDRLTSATLLDRADAARSKGELRVALANAGEALRASSEDHRARSLVAQILGDLGRKDTAVKTFGTVATMLNRRGYVLSAIAECRSALDLSPNHGPTLEMLGKLHDRIAGKPVQSRAHVPPPVLPVVVDEHDVESLVEIEDESKLISRVEKLATQDPHPEDAVVTPSAVPLFSELSRSGFVSLIQSLRHARLGANETILREGDAGGSLFMIVGGEVKIVRGSGAEEKTLAKLVAGTLFGEMALITDQPRSATVVTTSSVELFEIAREHVEKVAAEYPAITQELVDFAKRRLLRNLLETSPLFQPFEAPQRLEILRSFTSRVVPEGTEIIQEGSAAQGLFLVAAGEVRISKKDADGDLVQLATLKDGDVFGEISLLDDSKATATAAATRKTVLLLLPRERFSAIAGAHPALKDYLASLSKDRLSDTERVIGGGTLDADDLVMV